jgi:hypothetical protein
MIPLPSLFPETFFASSVKGYKAEQLPTGRGRKKFLLPDVSLILGEEKFADLYFHWHEGGIGIFCEAHIAFTDCLYPRFQEGDCLEVFIDTRDLKDVGVVHRFCHHFLFLPVEVQGVRALEITHFRGEDKHPLADPSLFIVEANFEKKNYQLSIFIPKEALFGYDPTTLSKMGFAYRLRRGKGDAQHFPTSFIERFPSLWSTIMLENNI